MEVSFFICLSFKLICPVQKHSSAHLIYDTSFSEKNEEYYLPLTNTPFNNIEASIIFGTDFVGFAFSFGPIDRKSFFKENTTRWKVHFFTAATLTYRTVRYHFFWSKR